MSPAARAATLQARRSARFVAWVRAWRAGLVPCDDAAAEISGDEEHMVSDVPGTWTDVSLVDAITALSKLHPDEVRLVLPAPGDPRGLPGPGPFSGAALLAGEGVIAGGLGFVPEVRLHTSGSGDEFETVRWQVFVLPAAVPPPLDGPSTAEAEAELSAELATATRTLAKLDIAQWRPELAGAIEALRKPDGATDLPPGYDPRARRLYARAAILDRVLALAEHAAPGGAINGYEVQQRDAALRPLTTACRRALVAACNAPLI
ncbi:hypothetical protein [Dactylosporangium sp. NPDC000521]|uniref:hypothetical protein n=1 Tax=Dactylosporangium sp. NPDC000521 TaxID=3363975 RepID=UPI0036A26441